MSEFWTPERVKILREMAAAGRSAKTIALLLGATKNAVAGKCNRMNIKLLNGQQKFTILHMKDRPLSASIGCQYIAGEPKGDKTEFCNKPRRPESSYCQAHHALCHVQAERAAA